MADDRTFTRQRSRIEDIEVPAAGLCDGDVIAVAGLCAALEAGGHAPLSGPGREFFGELARQLYGLRSWRTLWLQVVERGLAESDGEG